MSTVRQEVPAVSDIIGAAFSRRSELAAAAATLGVGLVLIRLIKMLIWKIFVAYMALVDRNMSLLNL